MNHKTSVRIISKYSLLHFLCIGNMPQNFKFAQLVLPTSSYLPRGTWHTVEGAVHDCHANINDFGGTNRPTLTQQFHQLPFINQHFCHCRKIQLEQMFVKCFFTEWSLWFQHILYFAMIQSCWTTAKIQLYRHATAIYHQMMDRQLYWSSQQPWLWGCKKEVKWSLSMPQRRIEEVQIQLHSFLSLLLDEDE